jgi:hypothetical protein
MSKARIAVVVLAEELDGCVPDRSPHAIGI